ncbi:hypothetical protein ZWY2020_007804 [Hordeum vulgare]|nr:hypothetical protein ZWY2020_007804 [Hordeum vulgare]
MPPPVLHDTSRLNAAPDRLAGRPGNRSKPAGLPAVASLLKSHPPPPRLHHHTTACAERDRSRPPPDASPTTGRSVAGTAPRVAAPGHLGGEMPRRRRPWDLAGVSGVGETGRSGVEGRWRCRGS